MELEPVFSAATDMLRAIPRSELLIAAIAAMVLGEVLHHRVNEQRFRQAVFVVLAVTGGILAWPG